MTHKEIQELCWSRLPNNLRQRAVAYLQAKCGAEFLQTVREAVEQYGLGEWLPLGWHFDQGMQIRNLLRQVIKDRELPLFPEWYGPEVDEGNWDDYYVQCLEAAVGCR
jgi:hypothetical protein